MKAIRSDSEISAIAESCEIAALVLQYLVDSTSEGITTYDIDQLGKEKIAEYGAKSACYNYRHGANIFLLIPVSQSMRKLFTVLAESTALYKMAILFLWMSV